MGKYVNGVKLYHYAFGPMTVVGCDDKYVETTIDIPAGVGIQTNTNEVKVFNLLCVGHWIFENESDVLKIDTDFVHGSVSLPPIEKLKEANLLHVRYSDNVVEGITPVKVAKKGDDITPVKKMPAKDNIGSDVTPVKVAKNTGEIIKK